MYGRENGYYGGFGGRYVAEVLRRPVEELEAAFLHWKDDPEFREQFNRYAADFIGRPTPMLHAENLSREIGGAQIYVKMEGLAHTGAHKINNALGQALLTRRMGKKRIIAETGAGQHGVATAAVCAKLGFECTVYMGEVDIRRQRPNVFWMELFGAKVVPVSSAVKNTERRGKRSPEGLGGEFSGHSLPYRQRPWASPVSGNGKGVSVGYRERGGSADCREEARR